MGERIKIYTKTGDKGETGLIGGKRVSKASRRIEAYGTVDELNAILGISYNKISSKELKGSLRRIQNELHIICADLANPIIKDENPHIKAEHVVALEELCDRLDNRLPHLSDFVLPGGSSGGAVLHYARTITRRAERRVIDLAEEEEVNGEVVRYLNRLSDCLFLMARTENLESSESEIHPEY